jgi:hypothetical protein
MKFGQPPEAHLGDRYYGKDRIAPEAEEILEDVAAKEEKPKQADVLIALARAAVDTFFQCDEKAYADVCVSGHRETWPLKSPWFRRWLRRLYYLEQKKSPNPDALKEAIECLDGIAMFEGEKIQVHLRVAGLDGRIYIDLGTDDWSAVEIDESGWRIDAEPPVRFRRSRGMRPLPLPEQGGSLKALRRFLNVRDDDGFTLIVAWLLAALRPTGPYPVLAINGEQGTAKSTLVEILRGLVDPNASPLRALSREDRDLFIQATNGWVQAFDNVSVLPGWLSDTLCRLATGGGFAVRQLYTDDDEVLFEACRPIVLNGTADMIDRGDLADRSVYVTLEPIPDRDRREEEELWREFNEAAPGILGALLTAVAHGLKHKDAVKLDRLPRMADFAKWATACEGAYAPPGTFMAAYTGNQAAAVETVVEADHVALAVRKLMAARIEWKGTATELKEALEVYVLGPDGHHRAPKGWPGDPAALSGRLRRAATALRKTGLEVEFSRHHHPKIITIGPVSPPPEQSGYKEGRNASPPPTPSQPSENNGLSRDGARDAPSPPQFPSQDATHPKPLKNNDGDGKGPGVAEFPTVLGAPDYGAPNRCAQCGGALPDSRPWHLGGHDVWLHGSCVSSWGLAPRSGNGAGQANGGASQSAGIPFVMTQEMRRRLRLCGYSHERIAQMTPQEVHGILRQLSS